MHRPSTSIGAKQVRPATAPVVESARDEAKREFHFRRLSLGDLTPELGDVERCLSDEEYRRVCVMD